MIHIYVTILGIYVLLFFLSWKEEDRNPFRKMAAYILRKKQRMSHRATSRKHSRKKDWARRQLENKMKTLQPFTPASEQVREYYLSQYSTILTVLFAGVLICFATWWSAYNNSLLLDGSYIWRNKYGQGDIPVELVAQIGGDEEIFQYIVEERKYTEDEAEALYRDAIQQLSSIICGSNESLDDVRYDLNLITRIDGYPFDVSWESSSYALVNTDGTVNNEELQESVIVMLTAGFRYEQWVWEHQMYVQVNPKVYTYREMLRSRIEALLHIQEEQTGTTEVMVLPDSMESETIIWKEIIKDSSGYLLILVILAAGLIYFGAGKDLDRKLDQRKKELLLDYPEIVNKLALYMGAGMTIRNAFVKMGEDYKKQQKERRRYVYEEILITCNELQSGRSENEAYDHFGKRCQVPVYMKLSTLLSQNIRKGSNDLLYMLRQEADNAFAERKNLAKKLGEEAGTKLLLPMMMMLCIVMVIIMIPAYFSFTMG